MNSLSLPLTSIKDHYQVVVIGSGYGGGVAASRLARSGRSVCVLERGKEFLPGDFPSSPTQAAKEFQVDFAKKHVGKETSLYDFRVNEDMNVLVGCGLGGTSLINANVSLRAEPRVFQHPSWPIVLQEEAATKGPTPLSEGYLRAEAMLKPVPYPENTIPLCKTEAQRKSAKALGEPFRLAPINVTFQDTINSAGISQPACNGCGDCVSGCNYGSKNTVAMNYLPDAVNNGAEIFTQVKVSRIIRKNGRWLVFYQPQNMHRGIFDAPEIFVTADLVVLAAGTLGSTEILLRSRHKGLLLSSRIGKGFGGNGDVVAFAYNCDEEINGIGWGDKKEGDHKPVGPCITSVIDARHKTDLQDSMVIEEGSLPGPISATLPAAFSTVAGLTGTDTDQGFLDSIQEKAREMESTMRGPYRGAMQHTQTFLVMSHDDADGEMFLEDDKIRVHWPDVGKRPSFSKISQRLQQVTEPLGGTYIPNPLWNRLLGRDLVTVHPLGGCTIADSAERGVVNDRCQVFNDETGNGVHTDLYVCDGAIIPRSLGVNPLLTITALAERACILMATDHGWQDGYSETSQSQLEKPAPKLGIQFTETMRGHFSASPDLDFAAAEKQGSEFSFTLTVISDDLETMLTDENHRASMVGTVEAAALSVKPLAVSNGSFQLFVRDTDVVGQRRMIYRMTLLSEEGEKFFLDGYKLIQDHRGFDLWKDTTTLYITVTRGGDDNGELVGRGILHITQQDFARQMTTMSARNPASKKEEAEAIARFGRFFGGCLVESYGGVFAPFRVFNPDAPPRARRTLRAGEPDMIPFTTADNVSLRLSRYQGGTKGPVMLSHGLGVSSRIFSLDTIETNLLEYFYENGFDVWLLDYRASFELPASQKRFSGDEIALFDYPAAVEKIRKLSHSETIQVVAHCFGAGTFAMAMMAGLSGVRSAVISQIAGHYQAPLLSRLKSGLYLPSVLDALGVDSLTAYRDTHANWLERLYDHTLRLYPQEFEERTNSPVDKRITFLYGQLWERDQLNTATHDSLHELFGVANIESFEHLALMLRTGHAVSKKGEEIYLPHIDRMAIPIRIIHGSENQTFLPESTAQSLAHLASQNGADLYDRKVIKNYGHIDCIFGKNAARDVYPFILEHLEKTAK